jgi:hypothetical protein
MSLSQYNYFFRTLKYLLALNPTSPYSRKKKESFTTRVEEKERTGIARKDNILMKPFMYRQKT